MKGISYRKQRACAKYFPILLNRSKYCLILHNIYVWYHIPFLAKCFASCLKGRVHLSCLLKRQSSLAMPVLSCLSSMIPLCKLQNAVTVHLQYLGYLFKEITILDSSRLHVLLFLRLLKFRVTGLKKSGKWNVVSRFKRTCLMLTLSDMLELLAYCLGWAHRARPTNGTGPSVERLCTGGICWLPLAWNISRNKDISLWVPQDISHWVAMGAISLSP